MLQVTIPETEYFDNEKQEFFYIKETKLQLEHSLVSISKWESKYHKPFMSKDAKTVEETLDYIKMMTLTQNVNPNVYYGFTEKIVKQIKDYIDDPMTATIVRETKEGASKFSREIITSELIYYWMITLNIPVEFQKWHLNRLLTLIRVCNIKNTPPKKMSKNELMRRNTDLNAARKAAMNTKG